MVSLSDEMVEKSIASAVAAIEVYNKPDFKYREETFAILMTNAWELLLKAKMVSDSGEDQNSIVVYESVKDKDGNAIKKPKVGKSGNTFTYGIDPLTTKLLEQKNYRRHVLLIYKF